MKTMSRIKTFFLVLWALRDLLVMILTPIILCPLLLIGSVEARCAFVLLLVCIYWMFEVMPLSITSVIPIFMFPTLGVMNAADTASAYLRDPVLFIFGVFVIAVAIEKWNLHERLALTCILVVGTSLSTILLGFMLTSFVISMWMMNTGTTAMLLPIAQAMVDEIEKHKSQEEDTKSTLLAVDEEKETGKPGDQVNKDSKCVESDTGDGITINVEEVRGGRSKEDTATDHSIRKAFQLGIAYSATMGGVCTLVGTLQVILMEEFLDRRYGPEAMSFTAWVAMAIPNQVLIVLFGWLWLNWLFIGFRIRDVLDWCKRQKKCNREEKKAYKLKVYLRAKLKSLGPMKWGEGATLAVFIILILLWFFADPKLFPGWLSLDKNGYVSITASSVAAVVALFIIPADPKKAFMDFKKDPTKKLDWERVLDRQTMQTKFPWMVQFLIMGCMLALGIACQKSGLSVVIAAKLGTLSHLDPPLMVFLITLIVSCMCEGLGNPSVVMVMLPILSELAERMHLNPLYFIVPMVLAASYAFMLPVSSGPNIIVFACGNLRVHDMIKAGFVMNLFCLAIVNLSTHTLGVLIFDVHNYPDWAPSLNASSSTP